MTVSQSSSSSRNFQITPSDQYYNNKKRLSKVYISRLTFVIGVGLILLLLFHQLISSSFSSSRPKTSAKHLLLQHDRRSNRHSSTALSSTSSSQKIFNEKYPLDVVNQLDNSRYVRLNGWHFCQCLEGSAFDAFTKIYPLGGSIATLNPTNKQVIQVIEKEAKTIFRKLDVILEDKGADHLDLWRFSCHFAADGVNGLTNITETRFIHQFDGENYFPFLSYVENDWKSQDTMMEVGTLYSTFRIRSNVYIQTVEQEIEQIRNKRRRNKFFTRPSYKIAYQILAHDIASAENIKLLITKLDSKDSIVMIHVDVKSPELRDSLLEFIRDRLSSGRDDNVFLQTRCFGIIWGHVSIVHAQIQGFFELIDLADWEYVINLSAYDWPLKKSSDIYNVLKENGTSSWIEYWKDPESSVTRLSRPHIALSDYRGIYHTWETGLRWWPYPNYHAYKHHQWMILHRSFIQYLRTDTTAVQMLAFMEFSWIPDESYFATVAVNSKQINVIPKSKRYIRFEGGWHPIWLTSARKYDVIQSDDLFKSNFFIRKINSIEQPQLLSWIEEKSFMMSPQNPCKKDEIGFRPRCFLEILTATAESSPDNSLIVIPVNRGIFEVAMNLYCSLRNLNMQGAVMFWSIDAEVHQMLVSMGLLSYYSSEKFPFSTGNVQTWHKGSFSKIMRQKVDLWKMLIEADLDFWTLDADSIVLRDFRSIVVDSQADIHMSVDESNLLEVTSYQRPVPNVGMGMVHFSSRPGTSVFLDMISEKLKENTWMEDQEAVNDILKKELLTAHSSITLLNYKVSKKWGDLTANIESQHTHLRKPVVKNRVNIKLLDQMQFLNGHFFFSRTRLELRTHFSRFAVIHANGRENKIEAFKSADLWIYDKKICQDLTRRNTMF